MTGVDVLALSACFPAFDLAGDKCTARISDVLADSTHLSGSKYASWPRKLEDIQQLQDIASAEHQAQNLSPQALMVRAPDASITSGARTPH